MRSILFGVAGVAFLAAACASLNGPADGPATPAIAAAPSLPETDIFLGELSSLGDKPFVVADIVNVTPVSGYQNQPRFLGENAGRFYFVSEGASGKTDIWLYDYRSAEQTRLTDTPHESEFSPKPSPDGRLSFIQESADGAVTRVHALRDGAEPGAPGAPVIDFAPLGYYEWLNDGATLGVFYRSEPSALYLVDVKSGAPRQVFERVGRSFQSSPDGAALYATQADADGRHTLMRVDAATGGVERIGPLPGLSQDFWLMFDEAGALDLIISADGPKLLTRRYGADNAWRVAADVSSLGYGDISRIAAAQAVRNKAQNRERISPAPIAFVARPASD